MVPITFLYRGDLLDEVLPWMYENLTQKAYLVHGKKQAPAYAVGQRPSWTLVWRNTTLKIRKYRQHGTLDISSGSKVKIKDMPRAYTFVFLSEDDATLFAITWGSVDHGRNAFAHDIEAFCQSGSMPDLPPPPKPSGST